MILRLSDGKRKCLRLELHRKGQRYQEQLSPTNSPAEEALPRTYKFQGQTCLGQGVEAHTLLKRYSRNFLSHNHPDTAYLNHNSRSISTVIKCVFMSLSWVFAFAITIPGTQDLLYKSQGLQPGDTPHLVINICQRNYSCPSLHRHAHLSMRLLPLK